MSTQLYYSNHIETLSKKCAETIKKIQFDLTPISIIIPNPYLKKWLQLQIAEINGITANLHFQYLDSGLFSIISNLRNDTTARLFDSLDLHMLILSVIRSLSVNNKSSKTILAYLNNDKNSLSYIQKTWQLSEKLARLFIEYEHYRSDMIKHWHSDKLYYNTEMEKAQSYIYNSIFSKDGIRDSMMPHTYTLAQYIDQFPITEETYSGKVIFFGKSQLSPFHIKTIYELGKIIDLHIFQLNPCSEFWEDVTSPAEDRWNRVRSINIESRDDGQFLSENTLDNQLLKLWGTSGRETLKLLSILEEEGSKELNLISEWLLPDTFHPPQNCLQNVQDRILLRSPSAENTQRIEQDTSLQIISCPDIFREVESVYNSILYNLDTDSNLKMTDIAVMVPDMNLYGPIIKSVFTKDANALSFSMIDSTASSESILGKAIISLLQIISGDFSREMIFSLFYNPFFLEHYNMSIDDTDIWLKWVDDLNIFYDSNESDLSDKSFHTWRYGLKRLRLGQIMTLDDYDSHEQDNFKDVIPYENTAVNDKSAIDTFNAVLEMLHNKKTSLQNSNYSLKNWVLLISTLVDDFITIPETYYGEHIIFETLINNLTLLSILDDISNNSCSSFSADFILNFIQNSLSSITSSHGKYLTSGINISALIPKRQIPFKIIYVLGMQEGIFPGTSDFTTLDLRSVKRRIGDITKLDANRYLFLETMLSARKKMYITYVSKNLKKDQVLYHNSVIGQLLSYLKTDILSKDFKIINVPLTVGNIETLLPFESDLLVSDFIVSKKSEKMSINNYSFIEKMFLLNNMMTQKLITDNEIIEEIKNNINKLIPDFNFVDDHNKHDVKILKKEEIDINELKTFLINPAESTLKKYLKLYDDNQSSPIDKSEPYYTQFPYDYSFTMDILNEYIKNESENDIISIIKKYYSISSMKGNTPISFYADVDFENLKSELLGRINNSNASPGLDEFLLLKKNLDYYYEISIGYNDIDGDKVFPAVMVLIPSDIKTDFFIKGKIQHLWKNNKNDSSETLIVTNSTSPKIDHLLFPFLFYIIAKSGFEKKLSNFIGEGPFVINVSHKKGISSYSYHFDENFCSDYLESLILNFYKKENFIHLPLQIISKYKKIHPLNFVENPSDHERALYRSLVSAYIADDSEKSNPAYRPLEIMEIIDLEVPDNAYEIARDRLSVILKPFIIEKAQSGKK